MRHVSVLQLLSILVRFFLISVIATLIVLIIRQWNEGMTLFQSSRNFLKLNLFQLQFVAYKDKVETARGLNFSCGLKSYLHKWKISDDFSYKFEPIDVSKVVIVTYASSNHFFEARRALRSIRSVFKNKIIFYDLGLNKNEIAELKKVCNLEVRKFEFQRFPNFVSRLMGYNFKPIIMAEVFSEFEHFWIADTSVRFFNVTPFLTDFYNNITSSAIETMALRHPSSHSIFAATHPSMYEYLPIDAALAKELEMLDANTMFIARSEMTREAIKWNALCALTEECMAPSGEGIYCNFREDRYTMRAGCHRFDQSSINIIMASLLERDGWKRRDRVQDDSMRNFTIVKRGDGDGLPLSIPCQ
ncbi:hypothetical protein PMAYCL1PPCAC_33101 [Pristionchus mayeri]|uniref:Uncharacterized protein n=1 Tax=Pristionchus mayeri TaxID=1317129 RepID=A0AAN5DH58_9BILA|nr:hypothetical protein PMAYCL1PPCAC_33101 [Pristionchus mayeri]